MNITGYIPESINEGDGLRAVVFISGCRHYCAGCFSPHTWNFKAGKVFDEQEQLKVIQDIKNNPLLSGLTLCGGDPFFSAEELVPFVKRFRKECPDKDVWSYTGFTLEELLQDPTKKELLLLCDYIIDGRFEISQKDLTLQYRGSKNQRIINVKEALLKWVH